MQTFPFPPRIKLKWPYRTYYDSSFYQFYQLELLIRTSISVFKHILYTTMSYISNAKIGCNFITPLFHYTQLQHFYPEVPLQRTGHSTSILYKQRPLTVIYLYFSATTLSHVTSIFITHNVKPHHVKFIRPCIIPSSSTSIKHNDHNPPLALSITIITRVPSMMAFSSSFDFSAPFLQPEADGEFKIG